MKLLLQMIYEDGTVCRFKAGGNVEEELTKLFVDKIVLPTLQDTVAAQIVTVKKDIVRRAGERGIGLFRTTEHVQQDITDTLNEILVDLKYDNPELIGKLIGRTLFEFKRHSIEVVSEQYKMVKK